MSDEKLNSAPSTDGLGGVSFPETWREELLFDLIEELQAEIVDLKAHIASKIGESHSIRKMWLDPLLVKDRINPNVYHYRIMDDDNGCPGSCFYIRIFVIGGDFET